MARVAGRRADDTRAAALRVAMALFAAEGYAGVSLAKIAGAAGITPATLLYHFGEKQGLWDAVVASAYADLPALLMRIDALDDPAEIIAQVWDGVAERPDAFRLVMRASLDQGVLDPAFQRRMGPVLDLMVERAVNAWDVPPARARRAIVAVTHLLVRFATNGHGANAIALATDPDDPAESRAAVVALCASVATHLLHTDPIPPKVTP